ncbi:hypothetical protein N0V95_005418 [Ascochyta clinopodiicola]|nr:hypothetical protein N0V95_005418 [Ascochyta clinopodiicola]
MSSRLDTSHTEDEDIVVVDRDDISNYNAEQILPESPQEIEKIRSWLQATEYAHQSGEFRKHLASHMQGTGIWLTKSAAYISWLNDENHGLLWIKGIPGSGKSVVAAHLIRHLKEFHTPVLYFFFRQIIDANHEPAALLRDWLDQVLDYSPPLQSELKEFLKKKRSLSSVSMDDLWGFLRLALKSLPSNSFCVADALDEMDSGNEGFLRSLAEFGQWMPSKVKLLITSRPVPAIEATLRRFNLLQLSLEEKLVDTDISRINKRGSGSEDEEQRIRLQYPFYAINSALETLFANEQRAGAWLKFHWAESDEAKQGVTPLHIAARFGLTKFAGHLKAAGADIQAVDVHGAVSKLLEYHPDLTAKDSEGNGPLHIALTACSTDITVFEALLDAGADPDERNCAGETPLLALKMDKRNSNDIVDMLIQRGANINSKDLSGMTLLSRSIRRYSPAVKSDHPDIKALLNRGADPNVRDYAGKSLLHHAVATHDCLRFAFGLKNQSSTSKLDYLLDLSLDRRVQDYRGNSLIHELASREGADASSKALWIACSEFEDEEQLWIQDRRAEDLMSNGEAGGLTIEDKTRPGPLPNKYEQQTAEFDSQKHKTRLEEIVEILSVQGCDTSGLLQAMKGALSKAEQSYTFSCLLQARDRTLPTGKSTSTGVALFLESSISIQKEAQKKVATKSSLVEQDQASGWLVKHMLEKRQYHVIRSLFEHGVHFLKETEPTLELFVQHGYASLLEEIGTLEVERRHKEGVWHAFNDKSRPGLHTELELEARVYDGSSRKEINFLLTALRRNIPNMSVVRLLVENFHVDINAYHYKKRYLDNSRYELLRKGTALHEVAQGKYWWHVALAIPYLLAMGAKIDAKNHAGLTPLHIALGGPDNYVGPFHKEAVRALLTGGADVNEKDKKGMSCLAYTAGDPEMVKLLLDHHTGRFATAVLDRGYFEISGDL